MCSIFSSRGVALFALVDIQMRVYCCKFTVCRVVLVSKFIAKEKHVGANTSESKGSSSWRLLTLAGPQCIGFFPGEFSAASKVCRAFDSLPSPIIGCFHILRAVKSHARPDTLRFRAFVFVYSSG